MDIGNSATWHGPCKRVVLATKFRAYEPNSIMIVSTFEEDLLGLKEFANRLDKFIATEQKFVEGSLVIALSAKFGFGKTTFLKMWSSSLKNAKKKGERPFIISLNAWESDYYGDPLFAIISALVDCIQEEKKSAQKIIDAAKDVGWAMAALGGQMVKKGTGIDAVAAGKLTSEKRANRDDKLQIQTDTFSAYQDRKEAMQNLKLALQDFIKKNRGKVFFLVDELDRCRPDYAISYLETIKHIFDLKGAVFVLAADRQQLENSAKEAFGADLDFEEYYRKFIHREGSLPEISEENYTKLVQEYVGFYLHQEGSRICFMKLDYERLANISRLVSALKLTPRQIQEVFRILGHLLETTEEKRGKLLWKLAVISILMAALKVGESEVFDRLGNQKLEPREAIKYFMDLLGEKEADWWFKMILSGGGIKTKNDDTFEEIIREVGLPVDNVSWGLGWREPPIPGSSRFIEIREKIEQISKWG